MVKNLYLKGSTRDDCSLPYFKNKLNRKNVNGKVKGKYQAHNDFVHTVGSSLMLRLAMDKMAMENIGDKPNCPGLPENIGRTHLPGRNNTFDQMMKQIVDEVYKPFTPPEPDRYMPINIHVPGRGLMPIRINYGMLQRERAMQVGVHVDGRIHMVLIRLNDDSQDDVKNYTTQLLQWYIHLLEFEDAIKEGDIVRCNICIKMMIPFFYAHSSRSKYLVECIDYILKTEAILPAALAVRCRLGSFINPHGKQGGNKPADMQQENNILVLKDAIKALGAGKSDAAIVRTSLAAPVADAITNQYKAILGMHTRSGHHVDKADDVDIETALPWINRVNPFASHPGRRMLRYRGIRDNAFARVDKTKFLTLLSKIANRLKRGLNVDENLYDEEEQEEEED